MPALSWHGPLPCGPLRWCPALRSSCFGLCQRRLIKVHLLRGCTGPRPGPHVACGPCCTSNPTPCSFPCPGPPRSSSHMHLHPCLRAFALAVPSAPLPQGLCTGYVLCTPASGPLHWLCALHPCLRTFALAVPSAQCPLLRHHVAHCFSSF